MFVCRKVCQRIRNGKGKMESRGNDERVKFVGPTINVRWREKICGPGIYVNDHITLNFSNYLHYHFITFNEPNVP